MYAVRSSLTIEDYLEQEKHAKTKHEYLQGYVYAMAGASKKHNQIVINILAKLLDPARSNGCTVYVSNMKLRVSKDIFYYPDLMVVCKNSNHDYYEEAPCFVLEVLSKSTLEVDKREKLIAYQNLPSLQAYLLVDSTKREIIGYYRINNDWQERIWLQGKGEISIPCPELTIDLEEVYQGLI